MDNMPENPLVPDMLYRHGDIPLVQKPLPGEAPVPEEVPIPLEAPISEESPIPVNAPISEEAPIPQDSPTPESRVDALFGALDDDTDTDFWSAAMPLLEDFSFPQVPADPAPAEDAPLSPVDIPIEDSSPADIPSEEVPPVPSEAVYETFQPEEPIPEPLPEDLPIPDIPPENSLPSGQEDPPKVKRKKTRPVKKGRPRRKKGDGFFGIPHLLATALWLAIILAIGTSLGKLLWVGAADVLAFGRESKSVTVTITASDDIDTIATKLGDAGLVRYPALFKFYATLTGADEDITTGTFELNTILDYHALTNALSPSSSSRSVVTVTIPEGYNCRQTFKLLADSNVCSVEALEEYAASGELGDYWFLENVVRGNKYCLEGFLFPDTYEFYENSTPREALRRMLNGFNNRFGEELIAQIDTLNAYLAELMRADGKSEEYIAEHVYTVREVVTVASLIEKETAGSSESATIASVIYNRLFHWGDYPAYLNIDASILYVVDGDTSAFDTKLDSPFNTYTHTGLTPTPITNPGLTSIQAALNPESTGYYYYVLNPSTGLHQFSATQEEHDAWIEKFRTSDEE